MLSSPAPTKPHFPILDGLRGVAAVTVVAFHLLEAHATTHFDLMINHGYLAVDFFFLLSGFVIGYAYDDRWNKMSVGRFLKLRFIRLQPMVVMGMIVGAICFYFQDSPIWPTIHEVPVFKMLLVMLVGFTLFPLPLSMDIRGWQEMHPLNGPGWSLFYEYVANILYGYVVRRFSNLALTMLVVLSAAALLHLGLTSPQGDVIGGWALTPEQIRVGLTRVMFPFFAGLLLFRYKKLATIKHGFFWCSLLILVVLAMPRLGGENQVWINGLYESFVIIFMFPLIVFMGASSQLQGKRATQLCKFLGEISYPIYITHYPIIYIYTGWVHTQKPSLSAAYPTMLLAFFASIALAYGCLKLYDEPVRKWLRNKFLVRA